MTTFTAGPGLQTLPLWIFQNLFRPNQAPVVNVAAAVLVLVSVLPVYLANRLSGGHRRARQQSRRTAHVETIHNIVDGKAVAAADGRTLDIVDPSTGEVYATSPLSGPDDVDAAFRSARTAYRERLGCHHAVGPDERAARDRRRRRRSTPRSSSRSSTATPASPRG